MERCYEYLDCKQTDCIMYKNPENKNCWEVDGTLCNNPSFEIIRKARGGRKIDACVSCIYYKAIIKDLKA